MSYINLNLTAAEFENLVKLVYMGNWVANATREPGEEIKKFAVVEQAVLKCAAEKRARAAG